MAYKFQTLAATMSGSLTQEGDFTVKNDAGTTGFSATAAGVVSGSGTLSAGGNLQTAGTVKFTGVADTAVAVSADSMFFLDADGLMKSERLTDYATAIAGDGLAASSGALTVGVDDSSIELNSDALRVKAGGITNAMLADDAVGADELAANAVVEASIVDNAVTLAKMAGITRGSIILGDSSGDPSLLAKGGAATFLQSDGTDPSYVSISGDATIAAGGALTIAAGAVEHGMLAEDIISGQGELAQGALAAADEFMISDGGTIKRYGADSFAKDALALTTEEAIANGDYIMFLDGGSTGETKKEALADVATLFAGDGLVAASSVLAVQVSGAVHVSSDKVALSGSVAGTGLTYTGGVDSILTLALDIDGLTALGGTGVAQGDHFLFSDAETEKKITFSNLEDAIFGNVSGDATVAAGGALTIAAGAVENSMLADDAVGADELAANAVVNASIASNAAIDLDKLDGGSCASALTDLAQGDFLYAGDVDDSNNIKNITFSNLEDAIFGNVSGDATIAAGGALTIAATSVQGSMLNDDCISGQSNLGGVGVDDADEFLFSDGGVLKALTGANLYGWVFGKTSGDVIFNAGGAGTIQANAVEGSMLNTDVISGQTELASDGLAAADELMISDGGTLKKIGVDNLFKDGPGLLTAAAVAVADDHIMFLDGGATGDAKIESIVDLVSGMAGVGLAASGGALAIELNECNAAAVNVAADSIAIIDADDSDLTKKESIVDLVAGIAGAGLSAASGQLSVQGNAVALKADSNALVEGYNYFADASSNATVTMPAAPSVGDVVTAKAGNLTSNAIITINKGANAHRIDGLEAIVLESPFASVTMVYAVANHWKIV